MADGHRIVAEHLVDILVIADRNNGVGNLADDIDLGCLTGLDVKGLIAFEPTGVKRCGHRVTGPGLGYIMARIESDASSGNVVETAHSGAQGPCCLKSRA